MALFALTSVSLLGAFAQHAATYAPADLTVSCTLWLVGLLTLLLIFNPQSDRHYRRRETRPDRDKPPTAGRPASEHVWDARGVVS